MAQLGKEKWEAIEKKYIECPTAISYNKLSESYRISQPMISKHAKANEWKAKRKLFWSSAKKVITNNHLKTMEHVYDKFIAVEQDKKLLLADKMLLKRALKELSKQSIDFSKQSIQSIDFSMEMGRLTAILEKIVDIEIKIFGQLYDDVDHGDDNEIIMEFGKGNGVKQMLEK